MGRLTGVGKVRRQLPEGHLHRRGLGISYRPVEVEEDGHLVECFGLLHLCLLDRTQRVLFRVV